MSEGVLLALPASDSSASTRARCRTRTSTEEQAGDIYKMVGPQSSFNTQEDYWIELYDAKGNTGGEIDATSQFGSRTICTQVSPTEDRSKQLVWRTCDPPTNRLQLVISTHYGMDCPHRSRTTWTRIVEPPIIMVHRKPWAHLDRRSERLRQKTK